MEKIENLHPDLRVYLYVLAEKGYSIIFTSKHRTIKEHLAIYSNQAAQKNQTFNVFDIPLNSRHLAKFDCSFLRAVDFKAYKKTDGKLEKPAIIKTLLLEIQKKYNFCYIGIGTDMTKEIFTHLDVDRQKNTFWEY